MAEALYLGVDGGGTGCRARLEDAEGFVLGSGLAGPATTRLGIDAAMAAVLTACEAAVAEAGVEADRGRIHAGIGLAGYGRIHGAGFHISPPGQLRHLGYTIT